MSSLRSDAATDIPTAVPVYAAQTDDDDDGGVNTFGLVNGVEDYDLVQYQQDNQYEEDDRKPAARRNPTIGETMSALTQATRLMASEQCKGVQQGNEDWIEGEVKGKGGRNARSYYFNRGAAVVAMDARPKFTAEEVRNPNDLSWKKKWLKKVGNSIDSLVSSSPRDIWAEIMILEGGRARSMFFNRKSGQSTWDIPPIGAKRVLFLQNKHRAKYLRHAQQIVARHHEAEDRTRRGRVYMGKVIYAGGSGGDDSGNKAALLASTQHGELSGGDGETSITADETSTLAVDPDNTSKMERRRSSHMCIFHEDIERAEIDGKAYEQDEDTEKEITHNHFPVAFVAESHNGEMENRLAIIEMLRQDLELRMSLIEKESEEEKLAKDLVSAELIRNDMQKRPSIDTKSSVNIMSLLECDLDKRLSLQSTSDDKVIAEMMLADDEEFERRLNEDEKLCQALGAKIERESNVANELAIAKMLQLQNEEKQGPVHQSMNCFEYFRWGEQYEERVYDAVAPKSSAFASVESDHHPFPTDPDGQLAHASFLSEVCEEEHERSTSLEEIFQKKAVPSPSKHARRTSDEAIIDIINSANVCEEEHAHSTSLGEMFQKKAVPSPSEHARKTSEEDIFDIINSANAEGMSHYKNKNDHSPRTDGNANELERLSKLHQTVENSTLAQTAILKRIAEENAAVAQDEGLARALAVEDEGERRRLESRAKALSGEIDRDEEIARAFQRGLEETVGSFGGERVGQRTDGFPYDYNSNVDTSQVDQDHMIALSLAQENFKSDVDPSRYS